MHRSQRTWHDVAVRVQTGRDRGRRQDGLTMEALKQEFLIRPSRMHAKRDGVNIARSYKALTDDPRDHRSLRVEGGGRRVVGVNRPLYLRTGTAAGPAETCRDSARLRDSHEDSNSVGKENDILANGSITTATNEFRGAGTSEDADH